MGNIITSLEGWLKQPFDSKGSAVKWVLFVGLLIIAAFMWQITLLMITKEIA